MAAKLDEAELKAVIAQEIANAESYAISQLTPSREQAINYYNGNITDVKDVEGLSKYVSRDVSNVVGWTLPDVMRVFTASERIVDCLPETEDDEATADQAADYMNFCFWRDNDGYKIMRDATWDSLVNKDGIVKQFWDIREESKVSTYTGLDEDEIAILMSEDNSKDRDISVSDYIKMEIIEKSKPYSEMVPVEIQVPVPPPEPQAPPMVDLHASDQPPPDMMPEQGSPDQGMPPQGPQDPNAMPSGDNEQQEGGQEPPQPEFETQIQFQPVMLYDLKVKRTTKKGRLRYQTVAPENFGTDPNAIDLTDNWRFQYEKCVDVTRSDLIKMGFARDRVDAIPSFNRNNVSSEDLARRNLVNGQYDDPETAMERVDLYEVYIKIDINDDGMAEIVKVMYAGNSGGAEILDWEEWDDETPYDKIPCSPVPHRFSSDSLADEVMDIQKFKTIVGRQMFDNLYRVNMPQPQLVAGSVMNMDAVANPGIGVPIILKANSQPVQWNVTPFIGDKALMALEWLDGVIEMRTGVSRSSMALDPETLQNQTAEAVRAGQSASHSQVELIARDQANLGWKAVFAKSLRIIVKNQDRPRTIKLRDKWVSMDPRQWNTGMDIVINVGLGTGSRDRDMAMLNNILQTQLMDMDRLMQGGFIDEAIDMIPKIIKTQIKIAEAAGVKSPETFYPEITPEQLEAMKQQAKDAAAQMTPADKAAKDKLDAEMQKSQAEMAMKQQQSQADNAFKVQQAQTDQQMKQAQLAAEIQLKREQLQAELQLKREQMAAELQLQRETAMFNAHQQISQNAAISSGVHMGGQPG